MSEAIGWPHCGVTAEGPGITSIQWNPAKGWLMLFVPETLEILIYQVG
jgi:hypothetical protein